MPMNIEPTGGLFVRDDDETLFSRDINGQLVRLDTPTEGDYDKTVTMQIDGQTVTVPMAEPLTDSEGNIIVDLEGRTTPRYTTIYDAAVKLYVKQPGDERKIPIPTLCHQPHMTPVAVCRLCVVQIYGQKRGQRAAERKLLPACQHPVKEGMEVFTMNAEGADGDRVRQTVKVMTEMLSADHLKPALTPSLAEELAPFNELGQMASKCHVDGSRFKISALAPATEPDPTRNPVTLGNRRQLDMSSPVFLVDHTACVLCDRCVRACGEVMENNVIGRTGKGAYAGIGFDLNDWMGESSCVKCGECMVSCPTSAITYKPVAQVKPSTKTAAEILPAAELIQDPIFAGIPPKFLLWQQGLVVRRRFKAGQELCRQGDAGNTAFIIRSGKVRVQVYPVTKPKKGTYGAPQEQRDKKPVFEIDLTPKDFIVGEMACVTGTPRSADVIAAEEGEVWEVRRNVLDRLMRLPSLRQRFDADYRGKALDLVLDRVELFKAIEETEYRKIVQFLRERMTFVRVRPGQEIFEQGDSADAMFLIRLGYVRIGVGRSGDEAGVMSAGPGSTLGEIGLLGLTAADRDRSFEDIDFAIKTALDSVEGENLGNALRMGTRGATCTALGHLEMARLSRIDFLQMVKQFPILRRRLIHDSLVRLRSGDDANPFLRDYVEQGLYEGQSILVLDLEKCTRCDECTRGCTQQHGTESHGVPLTRLLRDGRRFDKYLVATSCRSCTNAHCMVGCPVDAIHRGRHLQIVIEDHCIGCGLCASNCPYGSIFLMPNQHRKIEAPDRENPGEFHLVAQPKAVNCDLCDAEGERSTPEPRCVASCPHDAAHRMTGEQLLQDVTRGLML